jgi:hypothetical protein
MRHEMRYHHRSTHVEQNITSPHTQMDFQSQADSWSIHALHALDEDIFGVGPTDGDAPEKQLPTSIISQDSLIAYVAESSWERAPGMDRMSPALVLLILTPDG